MEFNQEVLIAAPREKVWEFIWSVEEFAMNLKAKLE